MTPPYTVTVQIPPRLARRRRAVRAWATGTASVPLSEFMPVSRSVKPSPAKGAMSAPVSPALRGGGATNPSLESGRSVETAVGACGAPQPHEGSPPAPRSYGDPA